MFTLVSLSPALLLPVLRRVRGIKVIGACFHMSGLRKYLLMVVMLMMVIQLPQNETFDQDRGRAVVSHGAAVQFLTITCGPHSSLWLCPRHCRCLPESLVLPTRCQQQASSIIAPKTLSRHCQMSPGVKTAPGEKL